MYHTKNQPPAIGRAKTRKELANELGISPVTLWRKLKTLGVELPPGLISPNTQKQILQQLGYLNREEKRDESI